MLFFFEIWNLPFFFKLNSFVTKPLWNLQGFVFSSKMSLLALVLCFKNIDCVGEHDLFVCDSTIFEICRRQCSWNADDTNILTFSLKVNRGGNLGKPYVLCCIAASGTFSISHCNVLHYMERFSTVCSVKEKRLIRWMKLYIVNF